MLFVISRLPVFRGVGLLTFVAGVFGLVIGSFLNVVIHRVPLGESIAFPGSKCPECGASIPAKDNVPVFSYLVLGGKCRNCGSSISVRYPLVEAATGVLFALAALRFGLGLELAAALVLVAALVALAMTDLEHRLLPNAIVGPVAVVGLVLSIAARPEWWWVYPVCALAGAGGLFAIAFVYPGGMGMGDVKMAGMLGCFLGPYAFLAIFIGALFGALVSGVLMAAGRMNRRTHIPFGTFMSLGGLVALFAGSGLWGIYLGLF